MTSNKMFPAQWINTILLAYNIIILWVILICLPFIVLSITRPKRRKTFWHRLGFSIEKKKMAALMPDECQPIWVHALSVGEVISSEPLVEELRRRYPQLKIVFSASTLTGFETAQKMFGNKVDFVFFSPFDLLWPVRKIIRCIKPRIVIIVETDIWPNFLLHLRRQEIPIVLVNARLSESSLKKYIWGKVFLQKIFECFIKVGVQSRIDAGRFMRLGVPAMKIAITGNIKFDQKITGSSATKVISLRKRIGFTHDGIVLVAGSTHPGEESILIKVFLQLKERYGQLSLIIAPRDPSRADKLAQTCRQQGINTTFLSSIDFVQNYGKNSVLIVNRIGVLRRLYEVSDISFIGGSLVRQGGHNPLEPANYAKPILFGPDMTDFVEISNALVEYGAALRVEDADGLHSAIERLICNSDLRAKMGNCAFRFANENRGAIENNMALLRPWLSNEYFKGPF